MLNYSRILAILHRQEIHYLAIEFNTILNYQIVCVRLELGDSVY